MNRKLFARAATALVLAAIVACGVSGQEVQTPSAVPGVGSPWAVTGGTGLFFPGVKEVNEKIEALRLDMRELRSEIETLVGDDMSLSELMLPVAAGSAAGVRILRNLSGSFSAGFELESLRLHHDGWFLITSPDKRVAVDVELSMTAGGGSAVLSVDSAESGSLDPWAFRITAGGGYYNATVHLEKQIQLHGIDEFGLREEADSVDGASAWGGRLTASVSRRISEAMTVEFSAAWRSLVFRDVRANVLDPTETIDLDLSGLTLSVSLSLAF